MASHPTAPLGINVLCLTLLCGTLVHPSLRLPCTETSVVCVVCAVAEGVTILFLPPVPSPPLSLMASDADSSSVSLTWSPPEEPNGILLFYRVVARQVGGNPAEIIVGISANMSTSDMAELPANRSDMLMTNMSTTDDVVSFTLTNLLPHTDYVITVQANTSAGYGNKSEELHVQTSMLVDCVCVCVCVCARACLSVCLCVPKCIIHSPCHSCLPTTEVAIVTIVVPVVVVTLVVVVAIPATVAFIALLCRKWRKKTTAPVGGTQDQGV